MENEIKEIKKMFDDINLAIETNNYYKVNNTLILYTNNQKTSQAIKKLCLYGFRNPSAYRKLVERIGGIQSQRQNMIPKMRRIAKEAGVSDRYIVDKLSILLNKIME